VDTLNTDRPPTCDCSRVETRRRIYSNGTVVAAVQCLHCGRATRNIPTRNVNLNALAPWDAELPERWRERVNAYYQSRREQQNQAWWNEYSRHLASPEWQSLRQRVFARANGLCEGCRLRPPVQVHHLTYERLGREMLFDLAAVCLECHESIHGRPIGDHQDEDEWGDI
jgi:hypothetical protein